MISTVPWPELLQSVQRIVHAGSEGLWMPGGGHPALEAAVPVRCYATPNFVFATIVARRSDLPQFLARSGRLQISSSADETVLLNFCPTAATVLADALSGIVSTPNPFDRNQLSTFGQGLSDLVLVFGRVLAVELLVPSHSIDVIATTHRNAQPTLCADPVGVGLN